MKPTVQRPINRHKAYHAHVYFDDHTRDHARNLCETMGTDFGLQVGRFHEKLVGPHPHWSCQIIFGSRDFDRVIHWLEEHRNGLSILVHGLTGDDLKDHTEYAYWLGDPAPLKLDIFTQKN